MNQFYQAHRHEAIVSPLVRLLPWTHNMNRRGPETLEAEIVVLLGEVTA